MFNLIFSAVPKSLVAYSSPGTLDRLRIDKEHRAVEEVLDKHKFPEKIIRRIHAASLLDVSMKLREQNYEIILFSCHGDASGLYLEGNEGHAAVPWPVLAKALKDAAPSLSVIILNACYSTNAQTALHLAAPYVILMEGSANDDAAILFSRHFLDEFYRTSIVQHAFRYAVSCVEQAGFGDSIKPVLARREQSGVSVIQACFDLRHDSIFIDLSEAEDSIAKLPISRHAFLSLLTRKIRVHSWIFQVERERATIPIGHFFGVFSWQNANDIVICHKVLQLRPDLNIDECLGWTRLMIVYNDLRSERYRTVQNPSALENENILVQALNHIDFCYHHTLRKEDVSTVAQKLAPLQYAVTISTVRAQCDSAKQCLESGALPRVVVALESAISSVHDLIDELTESVTIAYP